MSTKSTAPIRFEDSIKSWFFDWGTNPTGFELFKSTLSPSTEVFIVRGFEGLVPFDWGKRGVMRGQKDPLLGQEGPQDLENERAHVCAGFERLTSSELAQRIELLKKFITAQHGTAEIPVGRGLMPYIDLGTQLFGRHSPTLKGIDCKCRQPHPPSVRGFWEFYEHWQEYAEFLGACPSSPETWLRKQYPGSTEDMNQVSTTPEELQGSGIKFQYAGAPLNEHGCCRYGPYYRYAVCLATRGWKTWSAIVAEWAARVGWDGVYIDNAGFQNCWNAECESGYKTWLSSSRRYRAGHVTRYLTHSPDNLLDDASIDRAWQREKGHWRTAWWTLQTGETNWPEIEAAPDAGIARHGPHSCRLFTAEGSGMRALQHGSQPINAVPWDPAAKGQVDPVDAGAELRFEVWYRTKGPVTPVIGLTIDSTVVERDDLGPSEEAWTKATIDNLVVPTTTSTVTVSVRLKRSGPGSGMLWIDNAWLGETGKSSALAIRLDREDGDRNRKRATLEYWATVANDAVATIRTAGRKINPEFKVCANGFRVNSADYCYAEGSLVPELEQQRRKLYQDVGYFPGTYEAARLGQVVATNWFGYRFQHSLRSPGEHGVLLPNWWPAIDATSGQGLYANPLSVLLNLAESAAFGGGVGCDATAMRRWPGQHTFLDNVSTGYIISSEAETLRAVESNFWSFVEAHADLYVGYVPHATVGVAYDHDANDGKAYIGISQLAMDLAARGVLVDVLTPNQWQLDSLRGLTGIVFQDVPWMAERSVAAVAEYLEQGGAVVTAGVVANRNEWDSLRLPSRQKWPPVADLPGAGGSRNAPDPFNARIGLGKLTYCGTRGATADGIIEWLENVTGQSVRSIDGNAASVRAFAWLRDEGAQLVLTVHVLNYAVRLGKEHLEQDLAPLSGQKLSLRVPPGCSGVLSATLHSPECTNSSSVPCEFVEGRLALVLDGLVTESGQGPRVYVIARVTLSK